jgi:hypothetical protein
LTQKTKKFKQIQKDRLFYDLFEYCIGFNIDEASCLRQLDHAYIDQTIANRKQWREIAQQRWVNGRQKHGIGLSRQHRREITEKTVADLHSLADQLLNTQAEFKLVVSTNQAHVYTNDLRLIDQLCVMPALSHKSYSQAKITHAKNTVRLKNPQHAWRSYLKMVKLSAEQKQQLVSFFHNQQAQVRLAPSLKAWINQPYTRTQDYFFVDYNLVSWATMLSLVYPGIIRKTQAIVSAK